MREFNLLEGYPKAKHGRKVAENLRTIENRLEAFKRGKSFFDGNRNEGYGGFRYDKRWKPIAEKIVREYNLIEGDRILQINCEKGFLLNDIKEYEPTLNVFGTETSNYAIENAMTRVKQKICNANPKNLPFPEKYFDCIIAIGVVYNYNLEGCVQVLKEVSRLSRGNAFITLASYTTEKDYFLFRDWTLLGTTILKKNEWLKVMNDAGYDGDYCFTNAQTLNLRRSKIIE